MSNLVKCLFHQFSSFLSGTQNDNKNVSASVTDIGHSKSHYHKERTFSGKQQKSILEREVTGGLRNQVDKKAKTEIDQTKYNLGQQYFLECFTGCTEYRLTKVQFEKTNYETTTIESYKNTDFQHNYTKHYKEKSANQDAINYFYETWMTLPAVEREAILTADVFTADMKEHMAYLIDSKKVSSLEEFVRKMGQTKEKIEEGEQSFWSKLWNNKATILVTMVKFGVLAYLVNHLLNQVPRANASSTSDLATKNPNENLKYVLSGSAIVLEDGDLQKMPHLIKKKQWSNVLELLDRTGNQYKDDLNNPLIEQAIRGNANSIQLANIAEFSQIRPEKQAEMLELLAQRKSWYTICSFLETGILQDSKPDTALYYAIKNWVSDQKTIEKLIKLSSIPEEKNDEVLEHLLKQRAWGTVINLFKQKKITIDIDGQFIQKAIERGASEKAIELIRTHAQYRLTLRALPVMFIKGILEIYIPMGFVEKILSPVVYGFYALSLYMLYICCSPRTRANDIRENSQSDLRNPRGYFVNTTELMKKLELQQQQKQLQAKKVITHEVKFLKSGKKILEDELNKLFLVEQFRANELRGRRLMLPSYTLEELAKKEYIIIEEIKKKSVDKHKASDDNESSAVA